LNGFSLRDDSKINQQFPTLSNAMLAKLMKRMLFQCNANHSVGQGGERMESIIIIVVMILLGGFLLNRKKSKHNVNAKSRSGHSGTGTTDFISTGSVFSLQDNNNNHCSDNTSNSSDSSDGGSSCD